MVSMMPLPALYVNSWFNSFSLYSINSMYFGVDVTFFAFILGPDTRTVPGSFNSDTQLIVIDVLDGDCKYGKTRNPVSGARKGDPECSWATLSFAIAPVMDSGLATTASAAKEVRANLRKNTFFFI